MSYDARRGRPENEDHPPPLRADQGTPQAMAAHAGGAGKLS